MIRIIVFFILLMNLCMGDNFLLDSKSYRGPKRMLANPTMATYVTSFIIPLNANNMVSTPYGPRLYIDKDLLKKIDKNDIMKSQGMYMDGVFTIIRMHKSEFSIYRYSRDNSNLYARIAPNIYTITNTAGQFYEIKPMPKNINACSLVISHTFKAPRSPNNQFVLDFSTMPDKGIQKMLVECRK